MVVCKKRKPADVLNKGCASFFFFSAASRFYSRGIGSLKKKRWKRMKVPFISANGIIGMGLASDYCEAFGFGLVLHMSWDLRE